MSKICMCIGYFPFPPQRGGAEYQAYLLALELKKRQHDVFFISVGHSVDAILTDNGFKVYIVKPFSFYNRCIYFLLYRKLLKILIDEHPDVIYQGVCYSVTGIAAYYCKKHKVRMIWHIESDPDVIPSTFQFTKSSFFDYLEKKIAEYGIMHTDHIIAQTEIQNRNLIKYYRRSSDVIIKNFHPAPVDTLDKPLPLTVVWIANIKKLKQPELFIDLCEHFRHNDRILFIMIGRQSDHKYQQQLDLRINKLPRLKFTGELPIDQVNDILARSHIFVNTSLYEGFPNTFIQAWMRKVPVVSLNVDPDDMLKRCGIGFHSRTFQQMIVDIERLANDEPLREKMGKKAQKVAFKEFLPDNIGSIVGLFE